jgi:hypothetical protein
MTDVTWSQSDIVGKTSLHDANTRTLVGHILEKQQQFVIRAEPGSILDGLNRGPYLTFQEACVSVGMYVKGSCAPAGRDTI